MKTSFLLCITFFLACQFTSSYANDNKQDSLNFPVTIFISMAEESPTFSVANQSFRNIADLASKTLELRASDGYQAPIYLVITSNITLEVLATLVNELETKGITPKKFFLSHESTFSKNAYDAGRWIPFFFTITNKH